MSPCAAFGYPRAPTTVVLQYRPAWFRHGMILFALGLIALAFLTVTGVRASPTFARRRRAVPARR